MEFRKIEFNEGLKDYYTAHAPFGLHMSVRRISSGKFCWELENALQTLKKGVCANFEKAKSHCISAYQEYVIDNLSRC